MIGIDTNVLLRLWLNDDPAQNRRLDALLATHGNAPGSLWVSDVVIAEALWTLRSACAQDKRAQLVAVRSLLDEIAFAFDDRAALERACTLFEQASCGFSDCLIVARSTRAGCTLLATFDRRMRAVPGVRII